MRRNLAIWTLIAAFVLVFVSFGIDKFRNPVLWIGFLPLWMDGLLGLSKDVWIGIVGAIEIALGLMLVIPVAVVRRLGALFIALHLAFVVLQVGWNNIAVRDIGLMLSAVALFLLLPKKNE